MNGNRFQDGQYRYERSAADPLVAITREGESAPFVTYKYDEDGRRYFLQAKNNLRQEKAAEEREIVWRRQP
ncbi:hypothetical protein [Geobacillus sp. BMUD]|uniref:hypothetical protein n=1 Tax=Geobacillus sp. BMUD TaxID=2508876 RepID=UPI00209BC5D2|nr:hypothetical protein [Geobacillus sp. BMUD]